MYLLLLVGLVTAAAALDYTKFPGLNHDTWWGPDGEQKDDTRILRTKIEWPKEVIKDLIYRLKHRPPHTPTLEGTNYNYGLNTETIGYWLDYWADGYNFTQREAYMNKYPHFKTQIQGLWIHFIHIKPKVPRDKHSLPLLLLHGFPGSVREFYGAIEHLTRPSYDRNFVPELIIPSLPGFAYSDATHRPGLGAAEMAFILRRLMHRLGHRKYFAQGGDWGSYICSNMATFFPDEVMGYHSNLGVALTSASYNIITMGQMYPESIMPASLVSRLYPLENTAKFILQETGYFHIQAAKSDAIGYCVAESPASLVAWVLHLFCFCSGVQNRDNPMGGAEIYSRDEFLDNMMVYWVTGKITSAMRIYSETFNTRNYYMKYIDLPTSVPTIVVQTVNEIHYFPPPALMTKFTELVAVEPLDKYAHFFALEAPEVYSEMVLSGFQKIIEYRALKNMTAYAPDSC